MASMRRSILLAGIALALAVGVGRACVSARAAGGDSEAGPELVELAAKADDGSGWLGDLASRVPEQINLLDVRRVGPELRIEGLADSNQRVADFMAALEVADRFADLHLDELVSERNEGRSVKWFLLRLRLVPLQPLPGTRPARLVEKAEVAALLRAAASAGPPAIEFLEFKPGDERPGIVAIEVPVSIAVEGPLPDVLQFVAALGQLPGLIHLNIKSVTAVGGDPRPRGVRLEGTLFAYRSSPGTVRAPVPTDRMPRSTTAAAAINPNAFAWASRHRRVALRDRGADGIALGILRDKGYRLWRDIRDDTVNAEREGWDFSADDPLSLLGVIAIFEATAPPRFQTGWEESTVPLVESELPAVAPEYDPVWEHEPDGEP